MAQKGKLILDLVDSRERRITEPVDIELQHRTLSQRKVPSRSTCREKNRSEAFTASRKVSTACLSRLLHTYRYTAS